MKESPYFDLPMSVHRPPKEPPALGRKIKGAQTLSVDKRDVPVTLKPAPWESDQ